MEAQQGGSTTTPTRFSTSAAATANPCVATASSGPSRTHRAAVGQEPQVLDGLCSRPTHVGLCAAATARPPLYSNGNSVAPLCGGDGDVSPPPTCPCACVAVVAARPTTALARPRLPCNGRGDDVPTWRQAGHRQKKRVFFKNNPHKFYKFCLIFVSGRFCV
jgi:hypothetical protein